MVHPEHISIHFQVINAAYYGGRLRTPTFRVNPRLTRTLGRFCAVPGLGPVIEISASHLANATDEEILDTLKHECIHLAQWQRIIPRPQGDYWHNASFRKEAARLGCK